MARNCRKTAICHCKLCKTVSMYLCPFFCHQSQIECEFYLKWAKTQHRSLKSLKEFGSNFPLAPKQLSQKVTNSSDVFTNFFHKLFPRIISQCEQLNKKPNFLLVQNTFFFLSLPVEKGNNHNEYSLKKSQIRNSRLVKLSDDFVKT